MLPYRYVPKQNYSGIESGKMVTLASIEPLLPDSSRELEDLAIELTSVASRFAARLHPIMRASVGDLVRSMNCYYSNLIEGHNTLPIDIDRAIQVTSLNYRFSRPAEAFRCAPGRASRSGHEVPQCAPGAIEGLHRKSRNASSSAP